MFDFISDQCYDLAKMELETYYLENSIKKSREEIFNIIDKCFENNSFDTEIFSNELIEKSNLLKESESIYIKLCQAERNMNNSNSEEWE